MRRGQIFSRMSVQTEPMANHLSAIFPRLLLTIFSISLYTDCHCVQLDTYAKINDVEAIPKSDYYELQSSLLLKSCRMVYSVSLILN